MSTLNVIGTPGFIDPLYAESGRISETTDGYALGISILMCLTSKPAIGLLDLAADALEDPTLKTAGSLARGAWPEQTALDLLRVVIGLSWHRVRSRRMRVDEALCILEATAGLRPGISDSSEARECVICCLDARWARFNCGHAVCCEDCASSLLALRAPGRSDRLRLLCRASALCQFCTSSSAPVLPSRPVRETFG